MRLADDIWYLIPSLGAFERFGIGQQITSAADSIAANISEGFGRYHYKENRRFCYYARGSLAETKTWLVKLRDRGIIEASLSLKLLSQCDSIGKMLNGYIASIGRSTNQTSA
ncbi:MAG: four helix bundle protein [Rhodothermales bacterium]|nr:four helix bundle protein [Rhodothermales bacterium]